MDRVKTTEEARARRTWYVIPDYRPNGEPAISATVVDRAGQQVAHFEWIEDAERCVREVNQEADMTAQDQQQPAPQWTHDDNPNGCYAHLPLQVWAPPFSDEGLVAEDAAERIMLALREAGEHELAEALR